MLSSFYFRSPEMTIQLSYPSKELKDAVWKLIIDNASFQESRRKPRKRNRQGDTRKWDKRGNLINGNYGN